MKSKIRRSQSVSLQGWMVLVTFVSWTNFFPVSTLFVNLRQVFRCNILQYGQRDSFELFDSVSRATTLRKTTERQLQRQTLFSETDAFLKDSKSRKSPRVQPL